MAEKQLTLGGAIDLCIEALEPLDPNARETALHAVCSHLQIAKPIAAPGENRPPEIPQLAQDSEAEASGQGAVTVDQPIVDIRTLKEQKRPSSTRQMACLVAYYLSEHAPQDERKEAITKADLEKYFKQAQFQLPESFQDVLPNAKKGGYFESAGRGAYKLNAVGYNLIAHNLPANSGEN